VHIVINQRFYPSMYMHMHQDLTIFCFHFPFPLFPICTGVVINAHLAPMYILKCVCCCHINTCILLLGISGAYEPPKVVLLSISIDNINILKWVHVYSYNTFSLHILIYMLHISYSTVVTV